MSKFKLVPVEPTPEMLNAAMQASMISFGGTPSAECVTTLVVAAIKSAPQPAQQAEADALLNENRVLRESLTRCKDAGAAMTACWNEDKKEADALLDKALYVIESWERGCEHDDYWRDRDDAITAIRKYLGVKA